MTTTRTSRAPLVVAVGGSFVAFLDVTITNLAIPSLAHQYRGTSLDSLAWVITAYAVVFAALLAPSGRFADLLGRRRLYLVGMLVFGSGSLLCSMAPDLWLLLAARAVQAVGAAAVVPASLAIVLMDTPAERRTATIGLWSAGASVAAAVGPSLGGVLVDAFGWRALFVINVPIAALLGAVATKLRRGEGHAGRLPDLAGTVMLAIGIAGVVLAVTEGRSWGWTSMAAVGCLVAGLVLVGGALRRAGHHAVPAIETSLWRNRTYAAANVFSVLLGAALYAWMLLGVLFLTSVWHYSELSAGFAMSPGALAAAAVGIAIGKLPKKPSSRFLAVSGALGLAVVAAALSVWVPARAAFLAVWLPAGLISGASFGAMSVGVSAAAALSVLPQRFAGAVGLNVAARQAGGALGIAVLASLLAATTTTLTAYREAYLFTFLVVALAAGVGVLLQPVGLAPSRDPQPVSSSLEVREAVAR